VLNIVIYNMENQQYSKSRRDNLRLMIKRSNEVDGLIKKKKQALENRAKEVIVDFDIIFYQFKVIEKNMYGY